MTRTGTTRWGVRVPVQLRALLLLVLLLPPPPPPPLVLLLLLLALALTLLAPPPMLLLLPLAAFCCPAGLKAGGLQFRSLTYHALGARLKALADELCGGRMVALLEGDSWTGAGRVCSGARAAESLEAS